MVYFCLDCEASGPVPPLFNLLSVGVTVVREDARGFTLGQTLYIEVQPIFPGFDSAAMEVCRLDPERLRREGVEPAEAMRKLSDWVLEQNQPSTSAPVFVGHNAVFDWSYIAYYFAHFGMVNPFGYKGIDTKSLAMGRLGLSWKATSKEELQRRLDLPAQDPVAVHRADYDSWYQALILKALLERPAAPDA